MRQWWRQREESERRWLAAGLGCALLIAVIGMVWWPLQEQRASLTQRMDSQRQTLAWMEQARARVLGARRAEADPGPYARGDGQSLLSLVDAGVRRHGLQSNLRRAEPAGEGGVRLWLDGVGYRGLAGWLENLQSRQGVAPAEIRLERAGPGIVNAQLVLVGG